jgi:hypothetical protein
VLLRVATAARKAAYARTPVLRVRSSEAQAGYRARADPRGACRRQIA